MSNINFNPDDLFGELAVYSNNPTNSVNNGDITNSTTVRVENGTTFEIDDLTMTGEELKICMKTLLEITKKLHPEEFI
jgi:hypothetical protein